MDYSVQYNRCTLNFEGITFNPMLQYGFNLKRVAATSDDYAGDVLVQTIGVHYEVARSGSKTITSN